MRGEVVVSQDGAEKIEGYFRPVIFELVDVLLIVDGIWNRFLKRLKFRESRLTKNVEICII